jgi:hypothetical protein
MAFFGLGYLSNRSSNTFTGEDSLGVFLKECTSISGRSEEGVIEVRGRVYTGLDN